MFPLQGGSKKINHSLSFVLGPQKPSTSDSWIPNTFQDIRFEQTLVDIGINTPCLQ